jgi:hypothetical protein
MDMQKWLTTTNNAMRKPGDQGAGGGITPFPVGTSNYNPWGPTVKGDPNYNLENGDTGSTGMSPSV